MSSATAARSIGILVQSFQILHCQILSPDPILPRMRYITSTNSGGVAHCIHGRVVLHLVKVKGSDTPN